MEESNLKFMNNEHKEKLKQLGSVKLRAKLKYTRDKENVEDLTVFTFLKEIYNLKSLCEEDDDEDGDDEKNVGVSELVNSLTDEDIKNIINYIDSLDSDDITNKWLKKEDKIYHFLPVSLVEKGGVNEKRALELKKESLVLELMNSGINPFKIKECLRNESNNFNSLNWDKICKDAVRFKKEIQYSMDAYYENTKQSVLFDGKNRWDIPLLFLNYMYLIETLGNQSANNEVTDLCYKNISNGEYIHFACNGTMILFFLIKYLEYQFGNQKNINSTENLLEQKNKIFVETLMSNESEGVFDDAKKKLKKQSTDNGSIGLLLYNIDSDCAYVFNGLYKHLIPKFWEIIDGLPEQCIFVFAVEMMKEVTLTRQQLDSVKSKIKNENLHLYLEKFNYDPDHKKDKENIIMEGTKISWVNYLCEKLFLGIGCLPGTMLIVFLLALGILLAIAFSHWFMTLCCLGGAFVIVKFLAIDYMIKTSDNVFKKCVNFMQQAYDKTFGRWMKIWALHYPANEIPDPEDKISVPLNIPPSEIDVTQNQFNGNKNIPLRIREENDTNHENDNDNKN